MSTRIHGQGGVWLAIAVLAIGLLASLIGWRSSRYHEQSELQNATSRAAEAIRIDLLNDLDFQIIGLDRLAMLWEAADPPQPIWTKNAELYIQHRPGCVAVEWLGPDLRPSVVITGSVTQRALAFGGIPRDLINEVSRSKEPRISSPDPQLAGTRQWIIAYPVYTSGRARGFILAFFDVQQSLNYILGDVRNLGFSFVVTLPKQPEQALTGSSPQRGKASGTLLNVGVTGEAWKLHVWPDPDVIKETTSLIPELILGIGASLSLLLASCLYFVFRLSASSRRLRSAFDALREEITRRRGVEDELRRAHAELQTRIDQRTADLASSNALLTKEVQEHKQAEDRLSELTCRLFQLQDDERRRLARELHDGATQNLVALSMEIGMVRDSIPGHDISSKELVNDCIRLVDQSTRELRTVSYLLHPPYFDELGLASALRDYVDGFGVRSGIKVRLDLDPKLGRLGNHTELGIFRVVQEALSNIHRHSQSLTASISLSRNAEFVHIEIADQGCGIAPEILDSGGGRLPGVGLASMRERIRLLGGKLEIESGSSGTRIQAVVPAVEMPSHADKKEFRGSFADADRIRVQEA